MNNQSTTIPFKNFLNNSNIKEKHLEQFAETLLQYIVDAEYDSDLNSKPDIMLEVEDCKAFYKVLTGTWWKDAI